MTTQEEHKTGDWANRESRLLPLSDRPTGTAHHTPHDESLKSGNGWMEG